MTEEIQKEIEVGISQTVRVRHHIEQTRQSLDSLEMENRRSCRHLEKDGRCSFTDYKDKLGIQICWHCRLERTKLIEISDNLNTLKQEILDSTCRNIIILGERRSGKSVLLTALKNENPEEYKLLNPLDSPGLGLHYKMIMLDNYHLRKDKDSLKFSASKTIRTFYSDSKIPLVCMEPRTDVYQIFLDHSYRRLVSIGKEL